MHNDLFHEILDKDKDDCNDYYKKASFREDHPHRGRSLVTQLLRLNFADDIFEVLEKAASPPLLHLHFPGYRKHHISTTFEIH